MRAKLPIGDVTPGQRRQQAESLAHLERPEKAPSSSSAGSNRCSDDDLDVGVVLRQRALGRRRAVTAASRPASRRPKRAAVTCELGRSDGDPMTGGARILRPGAAGPAIVLTASPSCDASGSGGVSAAASSPRTSASVIASASSNFSHPGLDGRRTEASAPERDSRTAGAQCLDGRIGIDV